MKPCTSTWCCSLPLPVSLEMRCTAQESKACCFALLKLPTVRSEHVGHMELAWLSLARTAAFQGQAFFLGLFLFFDVPYQLKTVKRGAVML